jgi:GT2 family glycosyltransferase
MYLMAIDSANIYDISVIIPFHNKAKMTVDCMTSLLAYGPAVKEIVLVSNNSTASELEIIHNFMKKHGHIKLLEFNHPFNYQTVNNWAVSQSKGNMILFLNNDTELRPRSRGLLEDMYKKALKPDVGIVGSLLLYGDEEVIQHAGVFLVSGGLADHMYVGERLVTVKRRGGSSEQYPYDLSDRKMTAVTGAVSMVERSKFEAVKGFDEKFYLCGGDVDLCIRLNKHGYQTWIMSSNGQRYILHKESQSRAFKPITFNDFYRSYLAYSEGYDTKVGDPFLPKYCALKEVKR